MTRQGFTDRDFMGPSLIQNRISAGQVVLYRRVSTKPQAQDEYKHQLQIIKNAFPSFTTTHFTVADITEVISGLADPERRMAAGLGRALKLLIRNPQVIMLVSEADRIARQAEIFTLIQKQGLGNRVFVASLGQSVDWIIQRGGHRRIEEITIAQRDARREGLQKYIENGGVTGAADIAKYSKQASQIKKQKRQERQQKILSAVKKIIRNNHGRVPGLQDICDALNHLCIRTGQGRFFTAERLSQFLKQCPGKWKQARNSYARRRRRIRYIAIASLIELRKRRNRQWAMNQLLLMLPEDRAWLDCCALRRGRNDIPVGIAGDQEGKPRSRDGCRGPPDTHWARGVYAFSMQGLVLKAP